MKQMNLSAGSHAMPVDAVKTMDRDWLLLLHTFCHVDQNNAKWIHQLFRNADYHGSFARHIQAAEQRGITKLIDVRPYISSEMTTDGCVLSQSWDFLCTFRGYDGSRLVMSDFLLEFLRGGPVRVAQVLTSMSEDPVAVYTLQQEYSNTMSNVLSETTTMWKLTYSVDAARTRPKQHFTKYLCKEGVVKDFPFVSAAMFKV